MQKEEWKKWEKWLDQIKDISFQKEEWENCEKCLWSSLKPLVQKEEWKQWKQWVDQVKKFACLNKWRLRKNENNEMINFKSCLPNKDWEKWT